MSASKKLAISPEGTDCASGRNGVSASVNYDDMLPFLSSSTWNQNNESALLEPYTYITTNPGKEIRGKMIEAFNIWLRVPKTQLSIIEKIVSMLHNASLLVDDIEDYSELRRGIPVAHKIYGIPQTINTANYVYFLAYQQLFALRSVSTNGSTARLSPDSTSTSPKGENHHSDVSHVTPPGELAKIVNEELLSLHRGQGLELLWRDSLQCPTEEEYISMVNNKTGGLLRIAVKLMMACATANMDVNYVPLVNLIGVFFQIRDDYLNLQGDEYSANKGFAEDLTEGKFSFPIVHSVRADTSNRQILNVLQKRPTTRPLKVHAIHYMKNQTKSFEYTLSVMSKLEAQVRVEIHRLGGNEALERIVDILHVE